MKRSIAAALALVLLCSACMMCFHVPASAADGALYIRKIVSVVYDDSGSMSEGNSTKWAYANYAMQAFCGLMNSDDQLYITYMSDVAKGNTGITDASGNILGKMDLTDIKKSVDDIRKHVGSSGTPFTSIEVAFRKLEEAKKRNGDDANTQYWLVIITDGEFQKVYGGDATRKDLTDTLKGYLKTDTLRDASFRITYLAIGKENEDKAPDDSDENIFVDWAADASAIADKMSKIANQISGRSVVDPVNVVVDANEGKTVEIRSNVPLLNIAVLSQKTDANIVRAVLGNGTELNISRKVSLLYPDVPANTSWETDSNLKGTAFLINNGSKHIEEGTYTLYFDKKIAAKDIVVMFEPALEVKLKIQLKGKDVDPDELPNLAAAGDKITVSSKVYEMGTDKEVDLSRLPGDTQFELSISENGDVVASTSGKDLHLSEYELKQIATKIKATLIIPGFNPIESSIDLPSPPPPPKEYTITAEYGGNTRSVKYDNIASNQDLSIVFTVTCNGEVMTDPAEVQALNPVINASPQGNSGSLVYTNDGKIVFTPNAASTAAQGVESFDVEITCTLENAVDRFTGDPVVSAPITYTVLIADYQVFAVDATGSVKKTEFFGNQVGVSFYITKDGVKLDKAAVEKGITVLLNEEQKDLLTNIVISPDGTITVTPYSDEEYRLTFWRWWINWAHYFRLEGEDVTVSLVHMYGSASSTIDVQGETLQYQILNVYLPLFIEIALLLFLIWWVYAIIAKPKFLPGAAIYPAYLEHSGTPGNKYHEISMMEEVTLAKYNKFKYRWKPTLKPAVISIGKDIIISAGYGGSIICHSQVWYKGDIQPHLHHFATFDHPQAIMDYLLENDEFRIKVLSPFTPDEIQPVETITGPDDELYYVHTDLANLEETPPGSGILGIQSGTIFAYAIRKDK